MEEQFIGKEESPARAAEIAAASMLRVLNTAIITYASTYEAQGCPANLQALSGQGNQESTPEHARLIDETFLQEPAIKNGYEFRYLRIDKEHYQITATPVQFGSGSKSLFTDDTAVIRVTSESRPANANDPLLE